MTDIEYVLQESGFTDAGCMWGRAWWKHHKDKLYALGQNGRGNFLSAPSDTQGETCLWIYNGPFEKDFKIDGNVPLSLNGEMPDFVSYIFPTLFDAIHAVGWLMRAESWVAATAKYAEEDEAA